MCLFPQDMYADLRPFVRLFGEQWVLALLVVGVGAPLSEELLFRGFLLSALAALAGWASGAERWSRRACGQPCTPAIRPAGIVEVFLIGLFFSWLLWRTGSLRVRHLLPCALQLAHRTCAQVSFRCPRDRVEAARIALI